ncbi:MAG: M23 family metallopeptidase [Eubacteriales bacterium]|nr:M23 family metallopeptidase [Eubacteriales bacterium]
MDKARLLIINIKKNQLVQKIVSKGNVKKFISSHYSTSLTILLVLTLTVLTYSHVLNFINVQAMMIEEQELATRSFEVYFDGNHVGDVRDKQAIEDILSELKASIQRSSHSEIAISNTIEYVASHTEDKDLDSHYEIMTRIRSQIEYNILAYCIKVDGEVIGRLQTLEEAKKILEDIKAPYAELLENGSILDLSFAEEVEIVQEEVSKYQIDEYEQLLMYLQKGTTEEKTHIVESGENVWSIASKYGITVEELRAANNGSTLSLIYPGDKLSLTVPKPFIAVQTIEMAVFEERIPFETEYELVSWMYNDEYSTKNSGENGVKQVEAYVIKENGLEVSREVLAETVIKEPITKVMYNGIQEPPPKKGTGSFINPLPAGTVTSRYGARWGGFHQGLDIGARVGAPIKAADGGSVIYAGWFGDYGYMVEIDHGGGFTTRYAHCSQLYVSVGENVYQGKTIAAVGNTGWSTGPHVHFEVRKYGSTVNPQSYIGIQYR